jgi:hypothetical protein
VGGLMVAFLTKYLMDRYKDRFLESPPGGKSRRGKVPAKRTAKRLARTGD